MSAMRLNYTPRRIGATGVLAVLLLGWCLAIAEPVHAQGQGQQAPVQKQINPTEDKSSSSSDLSPWYIAGIFGLAILVLGGVIVLEIFFKFFGLVVQFWLALVQVS